MADIKMEFNGNVSIGKMFDIHDNQQVKVHYNGYSEDKEKQSQSQKEISVEEKVTLKTNQEALQKEIFRFVHPSLAESEEQMVNREVERLVKRFDMKEICIRLSQLKKDKKLLLPESPLKAYNELVRMGLPTNKGGFEYKTFCKYYNKV